MYEIHLCLMEIQCTIFRPKLVTFRINQTEYLKKWLTILLILLQSSSLTIFSTQ